MIHIGIFKIFCTWAKSISNLIKILIWNKIKKIQIEKRYEICQMSWLSKVSAESCQNTLVGLWANNKGFKRMLLYLNQLLLGSFINFIKSILSKAECFFKINKKLTISMFIFYFLTMGTGKICHFILLAEFQILKKSIPRG